MATERQVLGAIEKVIGVPVHRIPEEFERYTVITALNSDASPTALLTKIESLGFVLDRCWRRVSQNGSVGFAAVLYGPRTEASITAFVGETEPHRNHCLQLGTYLTPFSQLTSFNLAVRMADYTTEYLSEAEYRQQFPRAENETKLRRERYGSYTGISDFVNLPVDNLRAARQLSKLLDHLKAIR